MLEMSQLEIGGFFKAHWNFHAKNSVLFQSLITIWEHESKGKFQNFLVLFPTVFRRFQSTAVVHRIM